MIGARRPPAFVGTWAAVWVLAVGLQLGLGFGSDATFHSPHLIFWIVVIGAGGCAVVSIAIVVRAFVERVAETALLGSFLTGVSLLPLAHGLLIPGVLYGENDGVVLSVQLAVPIAGVVLLPLLRPDRALARWRIWVCAHLVLVTATAGLLLLAPDALPAATTGSLPAVGFALGALAICLALSVRQLRLALISRRWPALAISAGIALVGAAPMIFVAGSLFGAAFWSAHVLDITGVLLASVTALVAHRRGATLRDVLAPIEATTPLRALEIGLDPVVHELVADLERKDPITRDHVIRTARLAVLVATEMGLPPAEVRDVGLGAILHDIGKLAVPDEILNKSGPLDEDEFAVMRTHTVTGDAKVRSSPTLRGAAPFVRGHHERVDGRGYPDGLRGDDIPLGARIVAACDAWDAMSHTRQYREGMDHYRVEAILREHQGSQWDADVIGVLLGLGDHSRTQLDSAALDRVGREMPETHAEPLACCREALPV